MIWPHEDIASLNAFYGDPRGPHGEVSAAWAAKNLVLWVPPYPMFYSDGKQTPLTHLTVHRLCRDTFEAAFRDVLEHFGLDRIKALRLDISGGTFCYRLERGGSRLSVHSWGCAIDMDPGHNPFPAHWVLNHEMIDPAFVQIMQAHGFCWRGAGADIDPMHFQACRH